MIPKIIHYCWFGGSKLPKKVQKCIDSWHKYLPNYKIMLWNEQTFNVNLYNYTKQAYEAKKYAFVSDVARIKALQHYGGIYLDTDVEVFKSFDSILNNKCVLGFEYRNWIATSFIGCEKNHSILDVFEKQYQNTSFLNKDSSLNMTTNVERLTSILEEKGLVRNNLYQVLDQDIAIYPKEYFSPYDYGNCVMEKTNNSLCAHHFYVTWLPWQIQAKKKIKKIIVSVIGKKNLVKARNKILNEHENE